MKWQGGCSLPQNNLGGGGGAQAAPPAALRHRRSPVLVTLLGTAFPCPLLLMPLFLPRTLSWRTLHVPHKMLNACWPGGQRPLRSCLLCCRHSSIQSSAFSFLHSACLYLNKNQIRSRTLSVKATIHLGSVHSARIYLVLLCWWHCIVLQEIHSPYLKAPTIKDGEYTCLKSTASDRDAKHD